ncbi:hypothetical protein HDU76_008983 [Blyttiomyces sp. JEL0837]|nr:hypothetical protein HDU76_008983 [Blyttiomyces sp. JEL0837]
MIDDPSPPYRKFHKPDNYNQQYPDSSHGNREAFDCHLPSIYLHSHHLEYDAEFPNIAHSVNDDTDDNVHDNVLHANNETYHHMDGPCIHHFLRRMVDADIDDDCNYQWNLDNEAKKVDNSHDDSDVGDSMT